MQNIVGKRMPDEAARTTRLNMLAVQIAGELPGNRNDAEYVLLRIHKCLDLIYDESGDKGQQRPRLSVVKDDRAS